PSPSRRTWSGCCGWTCAATASAWRAWRRCGRGSASGCGWGGETWRWGEQWTPSSLVNHQHRRPVLDGFRLARMCHQVVVGVAVQHEAVVGVLAAGPVADRLGEVPGVHLPLTGAIRQEGRLKVRVIAPVHAADVLPEPVPSVLVGIHLVLRPGAIA